MSGKSRDTGPFRNFRRAKLEVLETLKNLESVDRLLINL